MKFIELTQVGSVDKISIQPMMIVALESADRANTQTAVHTISGAEFTVEESIGEIKKKIEKSEKTTLINYDDTGRKSQGII